MKISHLKEKLVKIIIPFYKNNLDSNESLSLNQCCTILANYPIVIVKPESLDMDAICQMYPQLEVESFDDDFFKDRESYNHLMLSSLFYKRFLDYEYILIYQLDAYVFRDELAAWCNKGYDYIGAPWIPRGRFLKEIRDWYNVLTGNHKRVPQRLIYYKTGNGGFSLRRVRSFYEIALKETDLIQTYLNPALKGRAFSPKDVFWALEPHRRNYDFSTPDYKEALLFSFDKYPKQCFQRTKAIPFGCHGWNRKKTFPFWRKII